MHPSELDEGGYSLGTLEGQLKAWKRRMAHFTNTNNPVDFPQDPKPELSSAAIIANINYYKAIAEKYAELGNEALQSALHWEQKLKELEQ